MRNYLREIYKRPNIATTLAFVLSKGWKLEKSTKRYYLVVSPKDTDNKENINSYYIPRQEDAITFDESAFLMIKTFSEIFDYPLLQLFDLLSQDFSEIQKQANDLEKKLEIRKAMVTFQKNADKSKS